MPDSPEKRKIVNDVEMIKKELQMGQF